MPYMERKRPRGICRKGFSAGYSDFSAGYSDFSAGYSDLNKSFIPPILPIRLVAS